MGSFQRDALRTGCIALLGVAGSACSDSGSRPAGHFESPASGGIGPDASGGDASVMSSGGTSGTTTAPATPGGRSSIPGKGGANSMTNAGAGGASLGGSGAGGVDAAASAGVAGGMEPSSGGTPGEPPLVVTPVETWGGKPLDMVPYATSGTRLKAVGYADEGAVFFNTMKDTALGIDCRFEQTETGDWLCSPTKKQGLVFLDAACTEPATEEPAFSMSTGEIFGFLDSRLSTSTGGSDTVLVPQHWPAYRVADVVFESDGADTFAEETIAIYTGSPTQCLGPRQANSHGVVNPPSIFRVTPVADSELVRATVRDVPLKGGLTLERLVTDDGAQLSGHLKLAGRECGLQFDGRCVPVPVGQRNQYADPECKEWAFRLPDDTAVVGPLYGADPQPDDTTRVYELERTSTVYSRKTRVDLVMTDGQITPIEVYLGCEAFDVSNFATPYYRRGREVTEELPKLDTVQFGTASLSPIWFFGVLAESDVRIQVQIHSPEGDWVKPNIRTSNGSVCAVYDDRYENQCLMMDGLSSLPVVQVDL